MLLLNGLKLIPGLQTVETDDPLKLILRIEGYSGFDIQKKLEAEGIYSGNCRSLSSAVRVTVTKSGIDLSFR